VGAVARGESSEPACPERMARWFPPYGPGPLEIGFGATKASINITGFGRRGMVSANSSK